MTLFAYVLLAASGAMLAGLLSSCFPRLGLFANGAALITVLLTPPVTAMGFGWTVLTFVTAGFGLLAALGGLVAERRRAAEPSGLPRAHVRT